MKKIDLAVLESTAIGHEERTVQIPLSEEETTAMQDQFFQQSVELSKLEEDFAKVKDEHKSKIKAQSKAVVETFKVLRKGCFESKEDCFMIDNQEDGVMEYYTKKGIFVYSRPLQPSERQLDAFSQSKIKKVK